jgi:hypothetical protein
VSKQPLVVAQVRGTVPVCVCRVEDGDPRADGSDDGVERTLLVTGGIRRQAHAAKADAELVRVKPGGTSQV